MTHHCLLNKMNVDLRHCTLRAKSIIIKLIYTNHREAATVANATNMTLWHMYLLANDVIKYKELAAILKGDRDQYVRMNVSRNEEVVQVGDIAKALDATLNSIHGLIDMSLDFDAYYMCKVTLTLHGVPSFEQECDRCSETTGLYPFYSASRESKLSHVHDTIMQMCVKTSTIKHVRILGRGNSFRFNVCTFFYYFTHCLCLMNDECEDGCFQPKLIFQIVAMVDHTKTKRAYFILKHRY